MTTNFLNPGEITINDRGFIVTGGDNEKGVDDASKKVLKNKKDEVERIISLDLVNGRTHEGKGKIVEVGGKNYKHIGERVFESEGVIYIKKDEDFEKLGKFDEPIFKASKIEGLDNIIILYTGGIYEENIRYVISTKTGNGTRIIKDNFLPVYDDNGKIKLDKKGRFTLSNIMDGTLLIDPESAKIVIDNSIGSIDYEGVEYFVGKKDKNNLIIFSPKTGFKKTLKGKNMKDIDFDEEEGVIYYGGFMNRIGKKKIYLNAS